MNESSRKRKACEEELEQPTKREKGVEEENQEKDNFTEDDNFSEEDSALSNNDFFGLPYSLKTSLEKFRNVKQLYNWQIELLTKLSDGNCNVIYSVPTSGGKTLVSELVIFKELLVNNKDALLILPYISIVQEKIRQLIPFTLKYNFLLEEYAGPKGTIPPKMRRKFKSLYIATIEKAHLLINCLIQTHKLDRIGLVVVDELHMVGDGTHRSTVLESLLIKLKLATMKNGFNIRLLGMSATLSNMKDIAMFLNADVFERNYRPVALREYVKFGSMMYEFVPQSGNLKFIREFNEDLNEDPQHLRILVKEVVPAQSCLVFCSAKKRCEIITRMLCKHLIELKQHKKEEKAKLIKDIIAFNNGYICDTLRKTIPYGIVYHHSGLTSDEREAIETAFLSGTLCCIVCTSTLAAGVNLPAQRVIIRDPFIGRSFMNKSSYKQMSGRAGRAGFSNCAGESILIASHEEVDKTDVMKLLLQPLVNCFSGLREHTGNGLATLILSLFHLQFVKTIDQVKETVLKHSLYGVQFGHEGDFYRNIENTFEKLMELGLLKQLSQCNECEITPLGAGVVKGLIQIDKCQRIYSQIKDNLLSFNLSTDLHLIYISTLLHDEDEFGIPPDASKCFERYGLLDDDEHKAAAVVGIKPRDITRYRLSGISNEKIKRFYVTLIVYDIKKNMSDISEVAHRFDVQRGTVQSLLTLIASNASALYRFFGELQEFKKLHAVFENFPQTLYYCCTPELIPLLELPAVKLGRAKMLHSSGFKTVADVAKASTAELCQNIENLPKKQAKEMIAKAKCIILATADELEEEAKELCDIVSVSMSN